METNQYAEDTGGFDWTDGRLFFEDLRIGSGSNVVTVVGNTGSCVHFINCSIGKVGGSNGCGVSFWNCRNEDLNITVPGHYSFMAGILVGSFRVRNGGYVLLNAPLSYQDIISLSGKTHCYVDFDAGGLGLLDVEKGVVLVEGASMYLNGYLWGIPSTPFSSYALEVGAGCQVLYGNAARLVVNFTTADTRIGGVNTAYGALPFINPANNAMVVVNT